MAKVPNAARVEPLSGKLIASPIVRIEPAGEASRLVLRAGEKALTPLGKALSVKLPVQPKTSTRATSGRASGRIAMWIGPDEWLVIDPGQADLAALCGKVKALHSAVDVSHRNTAIIVSGPAARSVISAGCPQDLSSDVFPVGACSRTILGKSEIILLREDEDVFRVECWRSFSDYVFTFLADAARDPVI